MAAFWTFLLFLCCLQFDSTFAKPVPEPKSAWLRKAHRHRKAKQAEEVKRATQESACVSRDAAVSDAPKSNIWQGLTGPETASVLKWLFQQKELNLTKSADAGEWDNSVYVPISLVGIF